METNKDNKKQVACKLKTLQNVPRYTPEVAVGLTAEQVESRLELGLVNTDTSNKGKSVLGIILSNTFTFFNLIYIVIATFLILCGHFEQCTFLPVVLINTLIAIVQEIRAKMTLQKLTLITQPKVQVTRDGETTQMDVDEVVLDDVVTLESGYQISADCIVLDGYVEVNESILTGESDAVVKNVGEKLFAGSFVVSGSCRARVEAVGKFNYISTLSGKAKKYQKPKSQVLGSLKAILYSVAVVIVPMIVGLYVLNADYYGSSVEGTTTWLGLNDLAITRTAGSIIPMIPVSPLLLTSVALAVSFVKLTKQGALAQELYSIEMLARVDTLCLDKTGTITDGTMRVVESLDLRNPGALYTVREIMSSYNSALKADNITSKALKKFYGAPKKTVLEATTTVPFSSLRKFSAVSFKNNGTYFLGAPEFVAKNLSQRVMELVRKYAEEGLRVLLLAHSTSTISKADTLPQVRRPVALIVIEDHVRSDAVDTIKWFKDNGVSIRVISGDDPSTVSNIALRVGVENAENYISLEGMTDEAVREVATKYTVFGRVSPDQKAVLIKEMKKQGHKVAMTGDGVNDILAMKQSDCSIAMASGSDAARKVSHLVLLNDSFATLPNVVAHGRQVVNNIQNTSTMFFMKTIYIVVINIMVLVMHFGFHQQVASPLENLQLTLLDWVVVALPTAFLSLQTNHSQIKGRFLPNVVKRCLPSSLTFIVSTVSLYVLQYYTNPSILDTSASLGTLVTITFTFGGLFALYHSFKPFDRWWKKPLYVGVWVVVLLGICTPFGRDFFQYATLNREQILLLLVEILAIPFVMYGLRFVLGADRNKGKTK